MTPESQVMRFIKSFFEYDPGIYLTRRNAGVITKGNRHIKLGEVGESDYFGVIDKTFCPECGKQTGEGTALFIEAKSAKGRLTEQQREFIGRMRRLGAVAIVAKPVPDEHDPTGFCALRRQLAAIRQRACADCRMTMKEQKKEIFDNGAGK